MSAVQLGMLLEPDAAESLLARPDVLVVDLCKSSTYAEFHVPGAVHLEYSRLVRSQKPVMGLLPDAEHLAELLSGIGLTPDSHVIAYDDEGGGKACRLLWTLDVVGHRGGSLLNGGLHAWANEGHRLETTPRLRQPTDYRPRIGHDSIADLEYIRARLGDPSVALLDVRSQEEYQGAKVYAARGGHIPGAVHMEWTAAMDRQHNLRRMPEQALVPALQSLGVTPDREVITYCQTHHRSAYTYFILKSLGYPRVRGYAGSWSEWGNLPELPVER